MFKVVKNDFMRNFFSPYIWCCIISVCALHYLNVLAESSSGITPDYEELVFYLDGGFSVVDWIICVIGGGIGFCDEMKSGYFKFNLARIDKSSYCFSKVLNAAISSFLCAFMGLELFHGIYYVFCLCTQHSLEIQQITLSKVCSYHAMIFGIALLCGIVSILLCITYFISDFFVGRSVFGLKRFSILDWCDIDNYVDQTYAKGQSYPLNLSIIVILSLVIFVLCFRKWKRD